uniref:Biogenesis of lysosome-related organelles complex 1 subunit 2 isoform X2 n=1 Tax=Petromyzon marinus TaxID=7757 RepID=A0AAJ7UKC7_PETMA|nr:biogenesis of lysosome-related organelles complex 1 subunit 2 isoform X2 [Petromyzon marinus]
MGGRGRGSEARSKMAAEASQILRGVTEPSPGSLPPAVEGLPRGEVPDGVAQDGAGTRQDEEAAAGEEAASTAATVEAAEEVREAPPDDVTALCRDMFTKMSAYLHGELAATCGDYRLLEQLNRLTARSYGEMGEQARSVHGRLSTLTQQYAALQQCLSQVDSVELQVSLLEQAAYRLDAHSKRLAKFKKLEKR